MEVAMKKIVPVFGMILLTVSFSARAQSTEKEKVQLLFPMVKNQAGFDTGIAISNTSGKTGTCSLTYFSKGAAGQIEVAKQTSAEPLPAGGSMVFSISSGGTNGVAPLPGFSGFLVAMCDFKASGFGYLVNSQDKEAIGYLAHQRPQ
jgi:hypothetical protein